MRSVSCTCASSPSSTDSTTPCSPATADSSWTVSAAAAARSVRAEAGRPLVDSSSERKRMSVTSASSRSVSLVARRTKSRVRLGVHLRVVERLEQAAQTGERRAQLVRDVRDELRAQLPVVGRLAGVGQEDERLGRPADLVGGHRHPVGAAPGREEAQLEALALEARRAASTRSAKRCSLNASSTVMPGTRNGKRSRAWRLASARRPSASTRSAVNGRSWKVAQAAALGLLGAPDRDRRALGGGSRRPPPSAGETTRGWPAAASAASASTRRAIGTPRVSQTPRTATGPFRRRARA